MTTEVTPIEAELDIIPPALASERPSPKGGGKADKPDKEAEKNEDDVETERRSRPVKTLSKELKSVRIAEDATLRDIVGAIGTEGSYRIRVSRIEPEMFRDPATNQMVNVGGFLKNYYTPVDEEILAKNHGGGRFQVQFFRKNEVGGFVHFTQRTIPVVGDPRTDDTFRQMAPPREPVPQPAPTGENPQLLGKMFDIMKGELDKKHDERDRHHGPALPDPGMQQVIALLQGQIAESNRQLAEMRKELSDTRNQKPVEDPIKEKILTRLMDDDSARLQACRLQYESEIRTLKESHQTDIRLGRDSWERERSELKAMFERELSLTKATHAIQLEAARGEYTTNMKLAEHENRRVERENGELKTDNKELRAKKEKGPLEVIKDAEQIKEALGVGDGDDKSGVERAIEMVPSLIEAAKTYFKPPEQAQQQVQQGQAMTPKRRMVKTPDGQKWILEADGTLKPAQKKPPPPPQPGPNGEPPIPEIPPEQISVVVSYLERAFAGNQEPEVVAQSGRSMVPEGVLTAIRDHGVDGFLSKVAKLPSTSPLMNQAGRNWVRRVGKALVGE